MIVDRPRVLRVAKNRGKTGQNAIRVKTVATIQCSAFESIDRLIDPNLLSDAQPLDETVYVWTALTLHLAGLLRCRAAWWSAVVAPFTRTTHIGQQTHPS